MRRTLMLATAAILLRAPAFATVMTSAPALSGFTGDYLECLVTNVSTSARLVLIQHIDFSGTVVDSTSSQVELAPGETVAHVANPIPMAASCRVTVSGSARSIKASAVYFDPDTNRSTIVLPIE